MKQFNRRLIHQTMTITPQTHAKAPPERFPASVVISIHPLIARVPWPSESAVPYCGDRIGRAVVIGSKPGELLIKFL